MEANGESTTYTVETATSDMRGAGTDANVYIEIFGQRDGQEVVGKKITLDNSANNFERGMVSGCRNACKG